MRDIAVEQMSEQGYRLTTYPNILEKFSTLIVEMRDEGGNWTTFSHASGPAAAMEECLKFEISSIHRRHPNRKVRVTFE